MFFNSCFLNQSKLIPAVLPVSAKKIKRNG